MPDAVPALPSQLGDFAVVGVLGTGGSGVVLDARWGHREIALKVLHPTLVATARERAQFLEEARRLQEISHPGVVKVLAVGELPDGRPYLAMEKLAGPTLAARLAGGALPVAQALGLFDQLARAVQALHDQGLVHRDLKPENVVLVGEEHAVLLDFGIAKELAAPASTTTQDGGVRGTPAYMAPERFFGQPASVATDVYELAVTLYAMLAGTLPWADCGDPEVRLNPTSLGDRAPALVDVEIRRALSTRAQNRPASARELAAAVLGAVGMPVTEAPRTTTQVPLGPPPGGGGPAWFEKRSGSGQGDRGLTPLAWAPTAKAGKREAPGEAGSRRWWPLAAAAVACTAAVIGWIVVSSDDTKRAGPATDGSAGAAGAAVTAKADPWNPSPLPPTERPIADLRAEMTTAVGKLPADTTTVIALGIAEMRADRNMGTVLAEVAARPEVQLLIGVDSGCSLGLADIDWVVLGSAGAPGFNRQSEVVIRGGWTGSELEACVSAMASGQARLDPITGVTRIAGDRGAYWVATDGPVAIISTRDDATAELVRALVKRTEGPAGGTRKLLDTLDRDATIWVAIDAGDKDQLEAFGPMPRGADAALWGRLDDGLRGRILGRFRTAADAKSAETMMRGKIDAAMKDGGDLLGRFELARKDRDVTLDAWVTPLTLGLAASSLAARK